MSSLPKAAPPPVDPALLRSPPPVRLIPVPPAVAVPTAALFGGLSRLRGRRAMHPTGVLLAARLAVPDDPRLPPAWRELDGAAGIIRFSKSIGLPGGMPDVLGMALRFGGQDLLLATALGARPLLQHILVPAGRFDGAVFSSLLPHRAGDGIGIILGRIAPLPPGHDPLDSIRHAGTATIALTVGGLLGGSRPVGTVTTTGLIEDEPASSVRFDPWRSGAGLRPVGPIQRMRAAAYAASRRAVPR